MIATCKQPMYGLKQDHSYTVLQALELKQSDRKEKSSLTKLVKLRNSYGENEKYEGPWSVTDEESWTPELKSLANFTEGEENTFYMTQNDFLQAFPSMAVAITSDSWSKSQIASDNTRGKQWDFSFENP